ncbi:Cof-like hydrolase [Gloeothece citriformis PCC 7424]|uniref:Cof-like hydrolase n=1 Tax=Gloeothece citriformis (strain PCC 7424) TaxID=65393 RepID=B7KCS2_GLOC7|nr:Cof-type HAD-IIB family hydrolase [Gloeothece citriformis]ACK71623.1 Cof-like hydrolase [Gloeothece citriformis PCC 7424]
MDIRLLVLDIDGTIAGYSNQVSQTVKQAVQTAKAEGIQVAIATGRMYHSALRFHATVGSELPLIAYNGAWIQDPKTQTIHRHIPVSQPVALTLLNYFEQPEWRSSLDAFCYINDQLYVRKLNDYTQNYALRSGVEAVEVGDLREVITETPTTKVLALCQDADTAQKLLTSVQVLYKADELYLTQSSATHFEATNPEATKGTAVRYLAEELLGLSADQVMAIGDNHNDIEMLKYVGVSVVMGNAPTAVQEFADWVAPDVEEDGVAAAIEKFLLN